MGSSSPQIKSFISFAYDFKVKRSDKNFTQLQRQLQILSVVSDLSVFEPSCIETLEFYTCIEELLTESDCKQQLPWKIIALLNHITQSLVIRKALRDDLQFIPVLCDFVMNIKVTKDKYLKVLQLIERLSYGIQLRHLEAWLLKFIPYLINLILEMSVSDDCVLPALSILTNLCRTNPPALSCLSETNNRKAFVAFLLNFGVTNIHMQLLISEILLHFHMELTLLTREQILNMVDLMFTAATDGVADSNEIILQLTFGIFHELTVPSVLQDIIRSYKKFETRTQILLNYIVPDRNLDCINVVLKILAIIVNLEVKEVFQFHDDIFCRSLPFLKKFECGEGVLQIIESFIDSNENILSSHIDNFISSVKEMFEAGNEMSISSSYIVLLCGILKLLEKIWMQNEAFLYKFSLVLQPSLFLSSVSSLIQTNFDNVQISPYYLNESQDSAITCSSMNPFKFSGSCSLSSGKRINTLLSEAVILMVCAMKLLAGQKPEYTLIYSQVLYNPAVVCHIVCCEYSSDPYFISKAVNLIADGKLSKDSISALCKAKQEANTSLCASEKVLPVQPYSTTLFSKTISMSCEENVDSMIERLKGTVEKTELRDLPLISLMDLYEYKMASFAHTEKRLQHALSSANEQVRKMNHEIVKTRTESDQLMRMLKMWEGRLEITRKEKIEVETNISRIQESSRKLREKLVKEKAGVERDVESQKREVISLQQSLEKKDEEVRAKQKQLTEAYSSLQLSQKSIQEEQEKNKNLLEVISKLEDLAKKMQKQQDDKEREYNKLEKSFQHLKKENSELELVLRSHEQTITEKETQIEEMTKENMTLRRIKDMIHNISAGTVPP